MLDWLKKAYFRIPKYGQLMVRKGGHNSGWYTNKDLTETYFSLMLKGKRRGLFDRGRFYIVLTQKGVEEAASRGEKNLRYTTSTLPFGEYSGIETVTSDKMGNLPGKTFECVFLHAFRYVHGGKVRDSVLVLSERQFRRSLARAKDHPELVVKRKVTDWIIKILYRLIFNKKI